MRLEPRLSIIQGLLFTYCTENSQDLAREAFITSKNVNNEHELKELFEKLTKPEFLRYKNDERSWHIKTLQHFLATEESFESVFYLFDTHFADEISDKRKFMKVLLESLLSYEAEANSSDSK